MDFTQNAIKQFADQFSAWGNKDPHLQEKFINAGYQEGHYLLMRDGTVPDKIVGQYHKKLNPEDSKKLKSLIFERAKVSVLEADPSLDQELLNVNLETTIQSLRTDLKDINNNRSAFAVRMGMKPNEGGNVQRWISGSLITMASTMRIVRYLDARKKGLSLVIPNGEKLPSSKRNRRQLSAPDVPPAKQKPSTIGNPAESQRPTVEFCVANLNSLAHLLEDQSPQASEIFSSDQRTAVTAIQSILKRLGITPEFLEQLQVKQETGRPLTYRELRGLFESEPRRKKHES